MRAFAISISLIVFVLFCVANCRKETPAPPSPADVRKKEQPSVDNLHKIALAIQVYANNFNGEMPETLQDLRTGNWLNDASILTDPLDPAGGTYSYQRWSRPEFQHLNQKECPFLWGKGGDDTGFPAAFLDGHVERLGDQAELLARIQKGKNTPRPQ